MLHTQSFSDPLSPEMDNRGAGSLILILIVAVLVAALVISQGKGVRRGVAGIGDPVQKKASFSEIRQIDGYDVCLSSDHYYDIEALVVSTKKYSGISLADKLSDIDVALAWGKVAEYNDRIDFHWSQSGRWYHWRAKSYEEIAPVGGEREVNVHSSNNHLIPMDESLRAAIKTIKKGDHIRIKGYLVNVDAVNRDMKTFTWHSSTSREDGGGGACEIIYVKDIEWLD